jgi:hypothetical protein
MTGGTASRLLLVPARLIPIVTAGFFHDFNFNVFAEGGCLLECEVQGDASVAVTLPDEQVELLVSPEVSEMLARLFLAGVMVGERPVRVTLKNAGEVVEQR